jgi:hypothetical protein
MKAQLYVRVPVPGGNVRLNPCKGAVEVYKVLVAANSEGFGAGEKVNRLKQIRLSLGVAARYDVYPLIERDLQHQKIAKALDCHAFNMHFLLCLDGEFKVPDLYNVAGPYFFTALSADFAINFYYSFLHYELTLAAGFGYAGKLKQRVELYKFSAYPYSLHASPPYNHMT